MMPRIKLPRLHCVLWLFFTLFFVSASAEIDDVQTRMLTQYELLLRWDNVKNNPEWVYGPLPSYSLHSGLYQVKLNPGESIKLRVPRNERLRILHQDSVIAKDDIVLEGSDGSGLYARLPLAISDDRHSLLSPIAYNEQELVRVSRPREKKSAIELAFFMSRHEKPDELAPYRGLISFNNHPLLMSSSLHAGSEPYWFLKAGSTHCVTVHGPARYAFESRLIYPATESHFIQTYQIHTFLDGTLMPIVDIETTEETSFPIYINASVKPVGRLQVGYIDVPAGEHKLALDVSANVFGRLLLQEQPDYLFSNLNAPDLTATTVLAQLKPSPQDIWHLTQADMHKAMTDESVSPTLKELTALRLVRDNSQREGALLGVELMQSTARKHIDYPAIQQVADNLEVFRTFYRDVYPSNVTSTSKQYMAWYIARHLHQFGEQGKGIVVGEQFLHRLLNLINNAYFFNLPTIDASKTSPSRYIYHIHPRSTTSRLRIVVDGASSVSGGSFYVKLGKNKPVIFHLHTPNELSRDEYALTKASSSLEILAQLRNELLYGTLSSIFGQSRINAPLIKANIYELTLPADANEVIVWRASKRPGDFFLALQYMTSKPFALTEMEYKSVVSQLPPRITVNSVFRRTIKKELGRRLSRSEKELENNWLPLRRFLKREYMNFSNGVNPNSKETIDALSSLELSSLVKKAHMFSASAQWLPALEVWNTIKRSKNSEHHSEAEKGVVQSLINLGEHYLAEMELRQILLFSHDQNRQLWAYQQLFDMYQQQKDMGSLMMLSSASVHMHPGVYQRQQLFNVLLDNNEYEFALMVGLSLPRQKQNIEGMLRVTYQLGWWSTFNQLLQCLPASIDRAFWRGLQLMGQGHTTQALRAFNAASARGIPWKSQIFQGNKALEAILSSDKQTRMDGIHAWEQWQSSHPGPFKWQEDASVIRDSAGATLIYSIDRDIYATAFQGEHGKPVKMELIGPTGIRLEIRPLFSDKSPLHVDGWIHIKDQKNLRIFPINNNSPAQGLSLSHSTGLIPGRKILAEFDLGPGYHSLEVDAGSLPFLVRAYVKRPEISVPVLPFMNADTVKAAYHHQFTIRPISKLPCLFSSCLTIIPNSSNKSVSWYNAISFPAVEVSPGSSSNKSIPLELKKFLSSIKLIGSSFSSLRHLATQWPEAHLLNSRNIMQAIAMHTSNNKDDIVRRMTLLLWLVEHDVSKQRWALAEGEYLASTYPLITELQSLKERMLNRSQWLLMTNVASSAGVYYRELPDWQPESPMVRIRKALLGSDLGDDQVLFGRDRLAYSFKNLRPTDEQVRLQVEDVSSLTFVPMSIVYQLDNEKLRAFTLDSPNKQFLLNAHVPKGEHVLRISISNPVSNQFLRSHLIETHKTSPMTKVERMYFVATTKEPVVLSVQGPTLLRIDEEYNGTLNTRYHLVKNKLEVITLKSRKNETKSLYRISQQVITSPDTKVPPRMFSIKDNPVSLPGEVIPQIKLPSTIQLIDGLKLAGQENGTWSYSLSANERKNFLQKNQNNAYTLEDFLEPEMTYRYFSENKRMYFKTTGLEHIRKYGGAMLGLKETIHYQPVWAPIYMKLKANAFYQNPNANQWVGFDGHGQWSAMVDGSVSQITHLSPKAVHVPTASGFLRAMSMKNTGNYDPRDVDQDIFTFYQWNHRRAIELSDVYYYRPWLDSLGYVGGSFMSNPKFNLFNPDNYKFSVGWRQLIGAVTVNPEYLYSQYIPEKLLRRSYGVNFEFIKWANSTNFFQVTLNVNRGIDVPITTGFIKLTWNSSDGRGFRDFWPSEFDFLDLRKREIPPHPNNYMGGPYVQR